jgi:hypothetical protein
MSSSITALGTFTKELECETCNGANGNQMERENGVKSSKYTTPSAFMQQENHFFNDIFVSKTSASSSASTSTNANMNAVGEIKIGKRGYTRKKKPDSSQFSSDMECKQTFKQCTCCECVLGDNHLYNYKSRNYESLYKQLYPNSPRTDSGKVCQNCYNKAKKLKGLKKMKETAKLLIHDNKFPLLEREKDLKRKLQLDGNTYGDSKSMLRNNEEEVIFGLFNCACCGELARCCAGTYGGKYATLYETLFPNAPLTDSGKVCDRCYDKVRQVLYKDQVCACCKNSLGKHPLPYKSNEEIYKILFPESPYQNFERVCFNCYNHAYRYRKKLEWESSLPSNPSNKRRRINLHELINDENNCDSTPTTLTAIGVDKQCACCGLLVYRTPVKFKGKYYEYFKQLFPEAPIGNCTHVCQQCYLRARQISQKDEEFFCVCCQKKIENGDESIHNYANDEQLYKRAYPSSPIGDSGVVCEECHNNSVEYQCKLSLFDLVGSDRDSDPNIEQGKNEKEEEDNELSIDEEDEEENSLEDRTNPDHKNTILVDIYIKGRSCDSFRLNFTLRMPMKEAIYKGINIGENILKFTSNYTKELNFDATLLTTTEEDNSTVNILHDYLYRVYSNKRFTLYLASK